MKYQQTKATAFRGQVNCRLSGTTFDANHLSRLIQLGISTTQNKKATVSVIAPRDEYQDKVEMRKTQYQNIRYFRLYLIHCYFRPDPAFLGLSRDLQKQQR